MPCSNTAGLHDFYCIAFTEAIAPYADIIVAMVAGHTHRDSWVTFTQAGVDLVQLIAPSLTPFSFKVCFVSFFNCSILHLSSVVLTTNQNPGFRVLTVTGNTLTSVDTYVADIGAANVTHPPVWRLEYSLPSAYSMPDLSSKSFDAVATSILTNMTRWLMYQKYHDCSMPDSIRPPCVTQACRNERFCVFTSTTAEEYANCLAKFVI